MTLEEILIQACGSDDAAHAFLVGMMDASELWDHLTDGDPFKLGDVDKVFCFLLLDLPGNSFYQKHRAVLASQLMLAITNWRVATDIEKDKSKHKQLEYAYVLRAAYVDIIVLVALLTQGMLAAQRISALIREHCHTEGLQFYLNEHMGRD